MHAIPLGEDECRKARDLAERARAGNQRAIARAISLVENGDPLGSVIVRTLFPFTGHAVRVGITGPPGVGKSSLISQLVKVVRDRGLSVGLISVDPSSPFTQGALLGDRIRLAEHFCDPEVFIRSMGTRGHLGGLAENTLQAALVLDAAGKDVIFFETVGVGQSEIAVSGIADTVVLALQPGSGDSIQALKAGIMEIPDIIVVNKADHPQAEAMLDEVTGALHYRKACEGWQPSVLGTNSRTGNGVPELWKTIEEHVAYLRDEGLLEERRAKQLQQEVLSLALQHVQRRLAREASGDPELASILARVTSREIDPLSAVDLILGSVFDMQLQQSCEDEPSRL
jgi:LAO/AO transport system kinase